LAEDNAVGELTYKEDDSAGKVSIITFPGRDRPTPMDYGLVKQPGSIEGMLVSVGGRDKTAHVILQDGDRTHTSIDVDRAFARKLAPYLFGETLRLHGYGRWQRDPDGQWSLNRFKAKDFEVLNDLSLDEAVDEIRTIAGNGWSETDDAIELLEHLRKGPDDRTH